MIDSTLLFKQMSAAYYTLRAEEHLIQDGKATYMVVTSSCLARFGVLIYRILRLRLPTRNGSRVYYPRQGTQANALCP